MTARDELEAIVARRGGHVKATASDILAAGYRKPRTLTTAEELDALPDGSMILDSDPDALLKVEGGRWLSLHDEDGVPYISSAITFPATVLHEPEAQL